MRLPTNVLRRAEPASLILLGAVALTVLPHLARVPLWLAVVCVAALGWRLLHDVRGTRLPGKWLRTALTLVILLALLGEYHTVLGRQAGSSFLIALLCLKLLETRSQRDMIIAVFLGYFLLSISFLFTQSIAVGAHLLLTALVLTLALVAASHPAGGWPVQGRHLRLAALLLGAALPIASVLFVVFPRLPAPLWAMPDDSFGAATGLSDRMSPGDVSRLTDSAAVAFRVQFAGSVPPATGLYWRGPVLSEFDGRTWSIAGAAGGQQGALRYDALDAAVHYTVTLEPHHRDWLFALELPAERPPDAVLNGEWQLFARRPVGQVLRYDMSSHLRYRQSREEPRRLAAALQLPGDAAPRTRRLADKLRAGSHDDAALVRAAIAHLQREPFYYTREPPLLFDDPVDEFLFETRRGFCEHYASSFVVLMRAAGIPARVVTGYQGGELNPLGDYLIVRQSDAHAWTEVWLNGQGWVRVDPTAAVPPERILAPQQLARARGVPVLTLEGGWLRRAWHRSRLAFDSVNHFWKQWVVGYSARRQQSLFERLGLPGIDLQGLALATAGVLAVVVLVLSLTVLVRPRAPRRDPVLRAWARFLRKLDRKGVQHGAAEGPLDLAQRARGALPGAAPAIARIVSLYIALRYRRKPTDDRRRRNLTELQRAVRAFRP